MRPRAKLSATGCSRPQTSSILLSDLAARQHIHIVFREIDSRFQQSDQRDQSFFDGLDAPRERALQLLRRNPCLVESLRFDQVAHRFGLGQIDAAAQEGPLRKLARRSQARPALQRLPHQGLQNHRRAVRSHFHYIFAGIGMGRRKEGHDPFVELLLGFDVEQITEAGLCMGQRVAQPQHRFGNARRLSARQPHDPNAAAPRRRRNRNNGLVLVDNVRIGLHGASRSLESPESS